MKLTKPKLFSNVSCILLIVGALSAFIGIIVSQWFHLVGSLLAATGLSISAIGFLFLVIFYCLFGNE